jgi:hypothetical protein
MKRYSKWVVWCVVLLFAGGLHAEAPPTYLIPQATLHDTARMVWALSPVPTAIHKVFVAPKATFYRPHRGGFYVCGLVTLWYTEDDSLVETTRFILIYTPQATPEAVVVLESGREAEVGSEEFLSAWRKSCSNPQS